MAKPKPKAKKDNGPSFGGRIVDRLQSFNDALDGPNASPHDLERYTLRRVKLNLEPQRYDGDAVRAVRDGLGVSQAVLARLLGASIESVQSWESGRRTPNGIASRFLDEIARDPAHWRERLRQAAS